MNRNIQLVLFTLAILIFVGVGYYSVRLYEETGAEQEGIVICNEDRCEKSFHIHADIDVSVCGEKHDFPKNKGSVTEQHTHAELNYIHIHFTYEVDRVTHEPLDTTLLELGNFFKNMEMPFSSSPATLGNYTVGDACPSGKILRQEDLVMTVNGEQNTEFERYLWQDKDDIHIRFE